MTREEKFMQEAIDLSETGMRNNEGGPFGCVIVKDDKIIGRGNNQVITTNDPTAHAEIVAIREACDTLNTFLLEGCEVFTSCEPCPMCLAAIYWARADKIYFANTRKDAAEIGFDDSTIYEEINRDLKDRNIPMINFGREAAQKIFKEWSEKKDKTIY